MKTSHLIKTLLLSLLMPQMIVAAPVCNDVNHRFEILKDKVIAQTANPVGPQSLPTIYERQCLGEREFSGRDQRQEETMLLWVEGYLREEKTLLQEVLEISRPYINCGAQESEIFMLTDKIVRFMNDSTMRLAHLAGR